MFFARESHSASHSASLSSLLNWLLFKDCSGICPPPSAQDSCLELHGGEPDLHGQVPVVAAAVVVVGHEGVGGLVAGGAAAEYAGLVVAVRPEARAGHRGLAERAVVAGTELAHLELGQPEPAGREDW